MTRRTAGTTLLLLTLIASCSRDASTPEVTAPADGDVRAVSTATSAASRDDAGPASIAIRDDCDPNDPGWNPTGGCLLNRGSVTLAEFDTELSSILGPTAVIGHPSWRNDPSYTVINEGQRLMVRNAGGRAHTFTRVENFGGGKVPNPALNKGLALAPECPTSVNIAAGGHAVVDGLAAGNHRFQCCIHPWMRAMVQVNAR